MQYRIYWKYTDGGRYATKAEMSNMLLRFDGQVVEVEWHEQDERCCFDQGITDRVIVELWTGKPDKNGDKIYKGDLFQTTVGTVFVVDWESISSSWVAREALDEEVIRELGSFLDLEIKRIGTIHDDENRSEL